MRGPAETFVLQEFYGLPLVAHPSTKLTARQINAPTVSNQGTRTYSYILCIFMGFAYIGLRIYLNRYSFSTFAMYTLLCN